MDILESFPHDVALVQKRCYASFMTVPRSKHKGQNPKFRPISRLTATHYTPSLVVRKENRKSKTIALII